METGTMKRLAAYGVTYHEGYDRTLWEKYAKEGVRYPHILMITGRPRITSHFFYLRAKKRTVRLIDNVCGTGDNIRQLIRGRFFPGAEHSVRYQPGEHRSRF